jgi:hypothetical protein
MDSAGLPDEDFDFCSGSCRGGNSVSSGTNPFVDYPGGNYRIVSTVGSTYPRNRGTNLGAPFNVDIDGNARGGDGAWDIGAFESPLEGTQSLPAPQNLRTM